MKSVLGDGRSFVVRKEDDIGEEVRGSEVIFMREIRRAGFAQASSGLAQSACDLIDEGSNTNEGWDDVVQGASYPE